MPLFVSKDLASNYANYYTKDDGLPTWRRLGALIKSTNIGGSVPASNLTRSAARSMWAGSMNGSSTMSAVWFFDTPVFRVLPAKSKISASFLMFYTRVPEGFRKVDDVRLERGTLTIEDRGAGKTVSLPASRSL